MIAMIMALKTTTMPLALEKYVKDDEKVKPSDKLRLMIGGLDSLMCYYWARLKPWCF